MSWMDQIIMAKGGSGGGGGGGGASGIVCNATWDRSDSRFIYATLDKSIQDILDAIDAAVPVVVKILKTSVAADFPSALVEYIPESITGYLSSIAIQPEYEETAAYLFDAYNADWAILTAQTGSDTSEHLYYSFQYMNA